MADLPAACGCARQSPARSAVQHTRHALHHEPSEEQTSNECRSNASAVRMDTYIRAARERGHRWFVDHWAVVRRQQLQQRLQMLSQSRGVGLRVQRREAPVQRAQRGDLGQGLSQLCSTQTEASMSRTAEGGEIGRDVAASSARLIDSSEPEG